MVEREGEGRSKNAHRADLAGNEKSGFCHERFLSMGIPKMGDANLCQSAFYKAISLGTSPMQIGTTTMTSALMLLFGCAAPVPKGLPTQLSESSPVMTTAQIKAELGGKDVAGTQLAKGVEWTQVTLPDGSLKYDAVDGHGIGHRVIRDNASCEVWPDMPDVERCYKFIKYGDNKYASYRPDGSISSLVHVVP